MPWNWHLAKHKPKKGQEEHHARLAALYRYRVLLTKKEVEYLLAQIRNRSAVYLYKQSNRVSIWQVTSSKGIVMKAVYDSHRKMFITFLPLDQDSYEFEDGWLTDSLVEESAS